VSLPSGIFSYSWPYININSQSIADNGVYSIYVIASDSYYTVSSNTFTVSINAQTPMFTQITNLTMVHRATGYVYLDTFIGGDGLTVTANYSKDGGTTYSIPFGIFTMNTNEILKMTVSSTTVLDTGVYKVGI
jgi:hypothetical protein